MGISKQLKEEAVNSAMNDPRVFAQVQKNTEKILNKKQRETFLMAKAAIKELLDTKYDDLIKTAVYEVVDELKKEIKEAIKE